MLIWILENKVLNIEKLQIVIVNNEKTSYSDMFCIGKYFMILYYPKVIKNESVPRQDHFNTLKILK